LTKKLTCISCPIGCELTVYVDGDDIKVEGNRCPRGFEYAKNEVTNPQRMLTISVKVENGVMDLVSARTDRPIPKKMLEEAISYIKGLKVQAPIKRGDIIVKDLLNTGANLIATRTVLKK